MKIHKFFLIAIFAVLLTVSCSKDDSGIKQASTTANTLKVARSDNKINTATLPQTVLTYIATNYPNVTVVTSEIENNGNYEVALSNGIELIFNSTGTFLGIDDDSNGNTYGDSDIVPANLPQVILTYIATNYATNTIAEAELENNGHYEIKLNNDIVLVFDANGVFLGTGVDQDDMDNDNAGANSETNINPATLPQTVLTYITTSYPNQTILEAEVEGNGHFEVTLSNGVELHFDANGVFLNTSNGDDNGDGHGD